MLRREQISVGNYVHACTRGVKRMPIYRQKDDLWRLLFNMFYLNHEGRIPDNWIRELNRSGQAAKFIWPKNWGKRIPLVPILGHSVLKNHLHYIFKEIQEDGISRFMHKSSMAYSKFINAKYEESGSLFQGRFHSRVIEDETDLRHLAVYVMVKNPFELYPGGLRKAIKEFDRAYEWAINYPFCSLADYTGRRKSPIVTTDVLSELFETPREFKEFARDCMLARLDKLSDFDFADT